MSYVLLACLAVALGLTVGLSAPVAASPAQSAVLASICCLLVQAAYLAVTGMYHLIMFVMQHIEQAPALVTATTTGTTDRRVIVSSLYLGGTGAYLALPALCLWDLNVTLAFLCVLTVLSLCEPPKYVDFLQRSVDTALTVRRLGHVHLGLHLSALGAQCTLWWQCAPAVEHHWAMVLLATASPLLLRGASKLPPSQVLEMGLPVSALCSLLVLCWYLPREEDVRFLQSPQPVVIAFLVLCPHSLAALLACLLQGFRQSLGTLAVVCLTLAAALRHGRPTVAIMLSQCGLLLHAAFLAYERHRTGATTAVLPAGGYRPPKESEALVAEEAEV
jgi:hypothetical protein